MSESARHAETGSTGAASSAKVMTSPVFEKKHQRNGRSAPAHQSANQTSPTAGNQAEILTPPSVSEKKPVTNGHASPVRLPDQTGVESLLKTDDRMRLARERREERERSLAMREQALLEKERRSRLQYERTREERWRRLEEQRQKEEQRRAAVEEKRRHQLEEEKERLEALMRKSLERSLQLENRNKRGTYGMNGQSDYTLPHDLIASSPPTNELGNVQHSHMTSVDNLTLHRLCTHTHSSLARCSSDAELCVPCPRHTVPSSPHRSLYCASPSRHRANTVALEMGRANSVPNTPKKKKLHTERRTPAGSPVRRAESPADVIRRAVSPKFSPTHTHSRNQSPVPRRHYTSSPLRHRPPTILTDDMVTVNRQAQEGKGHDPADKKLLTEMKVSVEHVRGTCKAQSPKPTDSSTDRSSLTSGKAVARTRNGDEVPHILAEQQRLSHKQKEREEKDRLKAEQQKKNQEDMKEKKRKAVEEKELQEKQEVERELIKQQEEQERQQRKKRIEEIMKRTRKTDGELKRYDSQELDSPPSNTHSHTLSPPVLHNTPALNPPDRRGTALNVEIAPVTPQRSSPMREEQSTQVKRINSSSEKLQKAQVKISEENHEKKLLPVNDREQERGQVISPELTQMTKQESGGQVKCHSSEQVKSPPSQQVYNQMKSPTSQQMNSQVKSPPSQQMNSQVKSPNSQQMNNQMKSPTSQQMNSQVKSPTSQQMNSQEKSPTSQQVNSQEKSPTSRQVNSQVRSPTSQQVNSQIKSPTSQQVNNPMKSPTSQQMNSQVKSPTSQQMNSQVKSPTSQQVNNSMKSPTSQQMNSQVKSPTSQQMNSQVKSPTSQQVNSQIKSPTSHQVNSQVKSPTSQQVNSQLKSPTSQQVNSQEKSPTSQQMNSQIKSPTSQQVNSQIKSPTSQQANSQVKSPTSQQMNSQVKSSTSQQVNTQIKSPTSHQVNSQMKRPTSYQVNSQMKSEQVNGQASSQVKTTMTPSQVTSKKTSESSLPLSPLPHSQFPPTLSDLEYLDKGDGARRESADAVQSMEFSPISKEELISIPKFSPVSEVQKVVNSTRVLEDLLDLTGHVTYPIMQYSTTHGDRNKNVIEPKQTTNTLNMRSRKE